MSNYIATTCLPQQGTCFVAPDYSRNGGIEYTKRNKCSFIGLAITELVLGICLIGIGIAVIPLSHYYYIWEIMATNIWGGALVILCSSFCFAQVCSTSRCTIGANLGLSIFGIILSLGLMGIEITAACFNWYDWVLITLHSLAAFFYLILFILFIVSTSRAGIAHGCCKGCCSEPYSQQEIVLPTSQAHVVTLSNGQTVLLQGHPQVVPAPSYDANPPQYTVATLTVPNPSIPDEIVAPDTGSINPSYVTDVPPKV